jgi:hypothetical protein
MSTNWLECAEESAVAVKEMIIRQNDILKERNLYLSDYKFHLMAQVRKEQVEQAVRTACLFLGEWGFTQLFKQWEQSLNYEVEEIEHNGAMAHSVHRKGTTEESSRVLITDSMPCSCVYKVSYGIQCCHDLAINGVFDLGKFSNPERWKLVRLLEMSRDTGSFICQSLSNVGNQSSGSRQELDDNEDGGQAAFLEDDDESALNLQGLFVKAGLGKLGHTNTFFRFHASKFESLFCLVFMIQDACQATHRKVKGLKTK